MSDDVPFCRESKHFEGQPVSKLTCAKELDDIWGERVGRAWDDVAVPTDNHTNYPIRMANYLTMLFSYQSVRKYTSVVFTSISCL